MRPEVILLLLITAFLWGTTPVLEKIGLGSTDPLTGVAIRSIAVTVALVIYLVLAGKARQVFQVDFKTWVIFSVTGLMAGLLGMLTYFIALKRGATSQIVPIAATYPLVTAILSVLILGEHVTFLRLIGTILIIAGIWFVRS
ncbi:MAG: EamA family transporter [Candidatus Omnitrophota bacterium]|nr:MAG: EamA family transporter [Candidatus Omnitrophota bacterium]